METSACPIGTALALSSSERTTPSHALNILEREHMSIKTVSITLSLSALIAASCSLGENAETEPLSYEEFVTQHIAVDVTDDGRELLSFDDDQALESWDEVERLYQAYWETNVDGEVSSNVLLNVLPNGTTPMWGRSTRGNLTYCVSDRFGTKKVKVAIAMAKAAADWAVASGGVIGFRHASGEDKRCNGTNPNVVFGVHPVKSGSFIARAFFPKPNQRRIERNVLVNMSQAFSRDMPFPLAGIMRHEIGHTLGLRHETTRTEFVNAFGRQCLENNLYRAITTPDTKSVMLTPACLGSQKVLEWNEDLEISNGDRVGIRAIYR